MSARFGRVELNIESGALDLFHPSEPRRRYLVSLAINIALLAE